MKAPDSSTAPVVRALVPGRWTGRRPAWARSSWSTVNGTMVRMCLISGFRSSSLGAGPTGAVQQAFASTCAATSSHFWGSHGKINLGRGGDGWLPMEESPSGAAPLQADDDSRSVIAPKNTTTVECYFSYSPVIIAWTAAAGAFTSPPRRTAEGAYERRDAVSSNSVGLRLPMRQCATHCRPPCRCLQPKTPAFAVAFLADAARPGTGRAYGLAEIRNLRNRRTVPPTLRGVVGRGDRPSADPADITGLLGCFPPGFLPRRLATDADSAVVMRWTVTGGGPDRGAGVGVNRIIGPWNEVYRAFFSPSTTAARWP